MALAVLALAACGGGGGGKSIDGIASCLKGKKFTVKRSGGDAALKMKGSLTVSDADLNVLMTVDLFKDAKSAKSYYTYLNNTHTKARQNDVLVLSGDEKGAAGKKFDSCLS